MIILSADDWVCIFVLFIVYVRHPAQGATGGWVLPGLIFQWFPLCEVSLYDTLSKQRQLPGCRRAERSYSKFKVRT